ncbi:hypothetical protein JKP88DRAFT_281255 [Tribonema minus]|uniref:Uncharacterized protein n=1 Tax=Tribonema minus TaxID=303371 RepID=A0A836CBF8_9STRA|nr:hypothetical protein JKP88DRAFT_281255 [Tribonema minus]
MLVPFALKAAKKFTAAKPPKPLEPATDDPSTDAASAAPSEWTPAEESRSSGSATKSGSDPFLNQVVQPPGSSSGSGNLDEPGGDSGDDDDDHEPLEDIVDTKTGRPLFVSVRPQQQELSQAKAELALPALLRGAALRDDTSTDTSSSVPMHAPLTASSLKAMTRGIPAGPLSASPTEAVLRNLGMSLRPLVSPLQKRTDEKWQKFQSYRRANRSRRQYATLEWFERRVERQALERAREEEVQRAVRVARVKRAQRLQRALAQTRAKVRRVHRADAAAQAQQLAALSDVERRRAAFLTRNEAWREEDEQRAAARAAAAAAAAVQVAAASEEAAAAAQRERRAARRAQQETEALSATQEVLALMRRAGVTAGVNAPPAPPADVPHEADESVVIWPRAQSPRSPQSPPQAAVADAQDAKELDRQASRASTAAGGGGGGGGQRRRVWLAQQEAGSYFNLQLSRMRAITRLRVRGALGPRGGVPLARELSAASCLTLLELRLPRCALTDAGLAPVLAALAHGSGGGGGTGGSAAPLLATLDLRENGLTAAAVQLFGAARDGNGLRALRDLDLGGNAALGDGGARTLAHQLLASRGATWRGVARLGLAHCGVGDAGALALWRALDGAGVLLESPPRCVCLRDNRVSAAARRAMGATAPLWLQL